MTAHLSPEDRDELRSLLSEADSGAMPMSMRLAAVELLFAAGLADAWDEGYRDAAAYVRRNKPIDGPLFADNPYRAET